MKDVVSGTTINLKNVGFAQEEVMKSQNVQCATSGVNKGVHQTFAGQSFAFQPSRSIQHKSEFLQGEHIRPLVKASVAMEPKLSEDDKISTEPSYWTMNQSL